MENSLVYNSGVINVKGALNIKTESKNTERFSMFDESTFGIKRRAPDPSFSNLMNDSTDIQLVRVLPQGIYIDTADDFTDVRISLKRVTKRYHFSPDIGGEEPWILRNEPAKWVTANGYQQVTTSDNRPYWVAECDMIPYMFKVIPELANQFNQTFTCEDFDVYIELGGEKTVQYGIRIEPRVFYRPSTKELVIPTEGVGRIIKTSYWSFDRAPYHLRYDPFEMAICGMNADQEQFVLPENMTFQNPQIPGYRWNRFRVTDDGLFTRQYVENADRSSHSNLLVETETHKGTIPIYTAQEWFEPESRNEINDSSWMKEESGEKYTYNNDLLTFSEMKNQITFACDEEVEAISLQYLKIKGEFPINSLSVNDFELYALQTTDEVRTEGVTPDGRYRFHVAHNTAGQCHITNVTSESTNLSVTYKYYSFGNYVKVTLNKTTAPTYYSIEVDYANARLSLQQFDKERFDAIVSGWVENSS